MQNYNKDNLTRARILRKNMTPWERKLWHLFLKNYPVRFQRQKMIANYIVDFYCAKAKLIIELDGSGHYETEQELHDQQRTKTLECMGFHLARYTNIDIDKKFNIVCEDINKLVSKYS